MKMLLKKISLKNIRSYKELEITFDEGSTLLSGDIGSGKTTILLAIEFALFGFIRGTISGSTLLRHGEREGIINLSFEIDNKNIEIQRTLKKTSVGIQQDSGYIIMDAEKTDLTAVELKSKILDLIGYPEDLLTKSKSLIFRYTVYTPQEEMKLILFENSDERLEKIRKLFDIDKYKRITENANLYAKELRNEIKLMELLVQGQEELKKEIKDLEDQIKQLQEQFEKTVIKELEMQEEDLRKEIEKIEQQEKLCDTIKNKIQMKKSELINNEKIIENLEEQNKEINKELEEIKSEPKPKIAEDNQQQSEREIKALEHTPEYYEKLKEENEKKLLLAKNKIAILENNAENAKQLILKIGSLQNCPTCNQKVTEEHKIHVESEQQAKITESEKQKHNYEKIILIAQTNLEKINKKLQDLREKRQEEQIQKIKLENWEKRQEKIIFLKEKQKQIQKKEEDQKISIVELKKILNEYVKQLQTIKIDEQMMLKNKQNLKELQQKIRQQEIVKAEIKQKIYGKREQKNQKQTELNKKQELSKNIQKQNKIHNWIKNHFINLVVNIEKHTLATIHQEFNQRFRDWFKTLIEDETIQAQLNDTFAPSINQNGYDTEIENLSGGEKTAVALAYRLALNKTINDYISNIKTKDIIILDEPTDGFSTDQLDKVRDVLEQLGSRQTIIVSHEPKMESFVENIIQIRKHDHTSEIV
ncbi:AAA family ATPase [Candidatus Woesearchaeota archaeon]|nr:AAA family ATPase [Candidatus Woesearchaeota archaeon]